MTRTGVSYFECRRLEYVRRDMEDLAAQGLSYVVHTLSEIDWFYHAMNGKVSPARSTMRDIVRATHDAGLEAWIDPWSAGYVFDGHTYSHFASLNHEICQLDRHSRLLPAACPNQGAFRAFMHDWVDAAMDLNPDMILWDKPHLYREDRQSTSCFYGEDRQDPFEPRWGCYCGLCQSMYREKFGESMPQDPDNPLLRRFRDDTIVSLLKDLLAYARSQGARNALTLPPSIEGFNGTRPRKTGPDWDELASLPGLDNLGTAPYPFAEMLMNDKHETMPAVVPDWRPYAEEHAGLVISLSHKYGLGNHLWIQGFSVPADDRGYIEGMMALAKSMGIADLAIWGLEGHADMSRFACECPGEVWNRFLAGRMIR